MQLVSIDRQAHEVPFHGSRTELSRRDNFSVRKQTCDSGGLVKGKEQAECRHVSGATKLYCCSKNWPIRKADWSTQVVDWQWHPTLASSDMIKQGRGYT